MKCFILMGCCFSNNFIDELLDMKPNEILAISSYTIGSDGTQIEPTFLTLKFISNYIKSNKPYGIKDALAHMQGDQLIGDEEYQCPIQKLFEHFILVELVDTNLNPQNEIDKNVDFFSKMCKKIKELDGINFKMNDLENILRDINLSTPFKNMNGKDLNHFIEQFNKFFDGTNPEGINNSKIYIGENILKTDDVTEKIFCRRKIETNTNNNSNENQYGGDNDNSDNDNGNNEYNANSDNSEAETQTGPAASATTEHVAGRCTP